MSLVLRPLTPRDFASVDALLTAAYAPSTSMLNDLVRYHRLQPDGWILALRDERPIGMGGALLYGARARIGLMAVLPEMQHQGIGAAIVHHLLKWIAHCGATTVFLNATPEGVPLYAKFGFVVDDTACAYRQSCSPTLLNAPESVTMPLEPEDLAEVIHYDEGRFGSRRTGVLTSYSQDFADRIFIARDSQRVITGYIMVQPHRLGPWLADTPEIAESLLQHALRLSFSHPPQVLLPQSNQAGRRLLDRAGFLPERSWQSMRLGGSPDLRSRQWLYGYANFYVG
jgi:GNAT superfamily N-acetyltransferase